MSDDSWSVICSSGGSANVKALGDFLTAKGIPCRITEPSPGANGICLLYIPRSRFDDAERALNWVQIAEYTDVISVGVTSGRLALEGIPTLISHPIPRQPGPFSLSVPFQLHARAQRHLNVPPISEEELTRLALSQRSEDDLP
jgi:hypothetical protein